MVFEEALALPLEVNHNFVVLDDALLQEIQLRDDSLAELLKDLVGLLNRKDHQLEQIRDPLTVVLPQVLLVLVNLIDSEGLPRRSVEILVELICLPNYACQKAQ